MLQDGFLSPRQVSILQTKLAELLAELRPNVVALVDAFDYPDRVLDSCLGRYDGQVYKALYEYAKSSPLNDKEVHGIIVLNFLKIDISTVLYLFIYHTEKEKCSLQISNRTTVLIIFDYISGFGYL